MMLETHRWEALLEGHLSVLGLLVDNQSKHSVSFVPFLPQWSGHLQANRYRDRLTDF